MPTPEQMLACIRLCQTLSNFYLDIHLFRFDQQRNELHVSAGNTVGVTFLALGFGNLIMMKLDFQTMPRRELRAYVLTHREDSEALQIYMERLRTEPGVVRQQGGPEQNDMDKLEQFMQERMR